jgi:DegV family protein with EDD domain
MHTAENLNVAYVPMKVVAGTAEFVDDEHLDAEKMMAALKAYKGKTSSACPSVHEWMDAFGGADWVFGVSITSALSGCYNSGAIAAEEYCSAHPEAKVFLLDSLSTGPEMQLILEKYQELIDGGLAFGEICEAIRAYHAHTHLVFSLESLDNLAKNGRVSPVAAKAIGILGLRIVGRASAEGTLEPIHKCRGEKKALSQLLRSMEEAGFRGGKVRISHSYNPDAAAALETMLHSEYPGCDVAVTCNRGLCCYYAEEGGLIVGFEDAHGQ